MARNAGVYEYLNDEFYPIDGRLFGNEGDDTFNVAVPVFLHGCGKALH